MSEQSQPIRSSSNALLKRVRAIAKGLEPGTVLLEGRRLLEDALSTNLPVEGILVHADRMDAWDPALSQGVPLHVVAAKEYGRLGSVKNPPPVMGFAAEPKFADWSVLRGQEQPLVLVVAGISDPVNFGALARSAEAAGARAMVRVGKGVHPWNVRALRGSMGSLLRLPMIPALDASQALANLQGLGFRQVVAATRGGVGLESMTWSGPIALWVSGETGASLGVIAELEGITIPLAEPVESLNVTVAASLLLFAAGRVKNKGVDG